MVRLYGTLAFKQENNYEKISYSLKDSMDNQIKVMIEKFGDKG